MAGKGLRGVGSLTRGRGPSSLGRALAHTLRPATQQLHTFGETPFPLRALWRHPGGSTGPSGLQAAAVGSQPSSTHHRVCFYYTNLLLTTLAVPLRTYHETQIQSIEKKVDQTFQNRKHPPRILRASIRGNSHSYFSLLDSCPAEKLAPLPLFVPMGGPHAATQRRPLLSGCGPLPRRSTSGTFPLSIVFHVGSDGRN